MTESSSELDRIVKRAVFIRGANRPFGELTLEDARARADELRAVTGWGSDGAGRTGRAGVA